MKKKKHKYFPYGYLKVPPISGWSPTNRKEPIRFNTYEKKQKNWPWILGIIILLILMHLIGGCSSYVPVYDPTGSTSKEFYDDLAECRFTAQSQLGSGFKYGYYEKKVVSKCMENRGYSIILNTQ